MVIFALILFSAIGFFGLAVASRSEKLRTLCTLSSYALLILQAVRVLTILPFLSFSFGLYYFLSIVFAVGVVYPIVKRLGH